MGPLRRGQGRRSETHPNQLPGFEAPPWRVSNGSGFKGLAMSLKAQPSPHNDGSENNQFGF